MLDMQYKIIGLHLSENHCPLISVPQSCSLTVCLVPVPSAFGSLPCLAQTCPCDVKSTSCIDLSVTEPGPRPSSRPRILLKAPTLAEMEEMNIFEVSIGRSSSTGILEEGKGVTGIIVAVCDG